jgi:hypothetical protein
MSPQPGGVAGLQTEYNEVNADEHGLGAGEGDADDAHLDPNLDF